MAESEIQIRIIKFTIRDRETAGFVGPATTIMSLALSTGDGDERHQTIPRLGTAARVDMIAAT
jgi:hypothetical protein